MTDEQKKSLKFDLGLLIGAVLGGLAIFFLSPKSREENRKMIDKEVKKDSEQLKKLKNKLIKEWEKLKV